MSITNRELQRILKDLGYNLDHQTGSHQIFVKNGKIEIIPNHKELAIGTARNIIKSISQNQDIDFGSIVKIYNLKF